MEEHMGFPEKASEAARRALYIQTRISIDSLGNTQIDSCRRILEYNDIYIKLRTVDLIVELWGCGLKISCVGADCVVIEGRISTLEMTRAVSKIK